MAEQTKMKARICRRPLQGLDTQDSDAVRAAILHDIGVHFALSGRHVDAARFFGATWEDQVDFSEELEPGGREEVVAATFLYLARRPEVVRRFREGESILDRRRVIGLLEVLDPAALTWRLDLVHVGEGEAGCGVFVDDWTHSTGEGVDALPEPFREWVDLGKAQVADFEMRTKPTGPPKPYLHTAVLEVNGVVPAGARGMAELVGLATDAEMRQGPLRAVLIFVLRDRTLERWEAWGELPCSLTDFIRAVVQHSKAEGAAFVHPCTVTFQDTPARRGIAVVAQRDGTLCRRVLPLTFAEDGTIRSLNPVYQDEGAPEEPWIGVPPAEGVTLSWKLRNPSPTGGVLPEG